MGCEMMAAAEGSAITDDIASLRSHASLADSSEFCLLWENADLVVRKPGHASMTSTSEVEDGWRRDHLAQSRCGPGGGRLDVIHVYR